MHLKTSEQESLLLGFGNYSCNWGAHIAGLYETENERDAIINGFLAQGVKSGDVQVYCPTEQTEKEFSDKFVNFCPECAEKLKNRDDFSISSAKDLYYPNGRFSPQAMDEGLNRFYAESQKEGKRNIRATAEMVWALGAITGVEQLMAYESRLNYFILGKPWVSICLYNTAKFSAQLILNVLKTHPYIINGGVFMQNPYFENPTDWLSINAPQFLPQ